MGKFSKLRKLNVDGGRPVRFVIHELEGNPVLRVLPATQANPAYMAYQVEEAAKRANRLIKAEKDKRTKDPTEVEVKPEDVLKGMENNRREVREVWAGVVVVGWERVLGDDGKPVEFTIEDCRDFLESLPDDIVDRLYPWCGDAGNFRPDVDPTALAKNS